MKNIKYSFIFIIILMNLGFTSKASAGGCMISMHFDINPKTVAINQPITASGDFSLVGSTFYPPGSANQGYCDKGNNIPLKSVQVVFSDPMFSPININIDPNKPSAVIPFSSQIIPSNKGKIPGNLNITAQIYTATSSNAVSSPVSITLTQALQGAYACINDSGKYECSPGNVRDCSDVVNNACSSRTCQQISDSNQCGKSAGGTVCGHQGEPACIPPPVDQTNCGHADQPNCPPPTDTTTGGTNINIKINNPLGPDLDTIPKFIQKLIDIVLVVGVPIVTLAIIYSGFLFVQAQGNPEAIKKAKATLLYSVIGAALLLGAFVLANAIGGTINDIKSASS